MPRLALACPRRRPAAAVGGARLVLVALALVVAACGGRAEERRTPAYDDIQRIFDQSCAGGDCHRSPTGEPAAGLDLAPGVSYQALVGRPSAAAPGRTLVVPGAPDESYLLCTIDPACGHRVGGPMPPVVPLSPSTIEAVRRWIADGARPDGTPPPPVDAGEDPAPVFAGLTAATALGEHAIELRWSPAFDRTPHSRMRYRVYLAHDQEALTFGERDFELEVSAATTATLVGLDAGRLHRVVVRARDEDDHEDANLVVRSVTTPDQTAPDFGGVAALAEPSPGTLEVTWLAADDNATAAAAIGYRVHVATQAGAQDFAAPTATVVGATRATISGLAPSTTYHVVVRAFDQAGNEDANLIERALTTLDTVAPTFAGAATATGAPSAVVLTWAAATDDATPAAELVYLVYRSLTPGAQDLTTPTYVTPPGATSFAAGGLAPNRTYHFVVRARDRAGNVDGNVAQRSAMTAAIVDLQAPVFAGAAAATTLGASTIRLTWSAAADDVTLTGNLVYRIYRATAPGGQSFAAATHVSLPGATAFVASGLAPETTYFFVIRAADQAGNQDGNLIEVSATTAPDTTAPAFGGITGAATASSGSIALAWAAATDDITPAGAISYDVYRAPTAGGQSFATPTYTSAAGATGLVATGLVPLTSYFFVVRARDQAGNADGNTAERSATTSADIAPPLFAGATAVTPTALPGQLDVSWAPASDVVTPTEDIRYEVYVATISGFQIFFTPTVVTAPGATGTRLTGLLASTTYFVVVRARDASGNIDGNTVERSATTAVDTLRPMVTGLASATALNPSRVRLTWAAGSDDVTPVADLRYEIYAATTAGGQSFAAPLHTSPPGATSFLVEDLAPATAHHFVVRARDQSGNRDLNTVERTATTPPITVSFAAEIQPTFAASCATANCHAPPNPMLGIDLSTAARSWATLVDQPSSEFAQLMRVASANAAESYLMYKLLGGGPSYEGEIMPPEGALPAAEIDLIRRWIDEGAVDN